MKQLKFPLIIMIGADDKGQLKQVFNHERVNLITSTTEQEQLYSAREL